MKFAMAFFFPEHEVKIPLARQLGVTEAVTNANRGYGDQPWLPEPFGRKVAHFAEMGLHVSVVESPTPLEAVKLGIDGRDEEIERFIAFLDTMERLDIHTVCYNWMPVIGWFRSRKGIETRGGAKVCGFDYDDVKELPPTEYGIIPPERMWANLDYFLDAVLPEAEKRGIVMALHPDDPPVPQIRGISRLFINAEAFRELFRRHPSEYNCMTMCQGSFAAAGENVPALIREFDNRIAFAHFRDVRGSAVHFEETFHDDGMTDMYACMKAYDEIGFEGCLRPDHVPVMAGEDDKNTGYSILGNLFAIGYMRGLYEAVLKQAGEN